MIVIAMRGANGAIGWVREYTAMRAWNWRCSRDGFLLPGPVDGTQVEAAAVAMFAHAATHTGAVSQVVQLDL